MFTYSQEEAEQVLNYLYKNLSHRKKVPGMVKMLKSHPGYVQSFLSELDSSISKFNEFCQGGTVEPLDRKDFYHSLYLSKLLKSKNLPNVEATIKLVRKNTYLLKENIVLYLNQYKFLDTMTPPEKLAAALTVLSYRSVILSLNPTLVNNKAMVGSSIEEMVCLSAIRGEKTQIFYAIKDWITTDKDEGFSPNLVKRVEMI